MVQNTVLRITAWPFAGNDMCCYKVDLRATAWPHVGGDMCFGWAWSRAGRYVCHFTALQIAHDVLGSAEFALRRAWKWTCRTMDEFAQGVLGGAVFGLRKIHAVLVRLF